ncbi:MAG: hypothetical protein WD314_08260 [Trueperaceae bacterium]
MTDNGAVTLPYRTGTEDIFKFIRILGRGKSFDQLKTMGFTGKNFVGTVLALRELGLADSDTEKLTDEGRRLSLSDNDTVKADIIRQQMFKYSPYANLLEARLHQGEESVTKLEWFETWWAQAGIGTSPNNRSEGALTFADLLGTVGLGTFVRGRRGHASRIEWAPEAFALIEGWLYSSEVGSEGSDETGPEITDKAGRPGTVGPRFIETPGVNGRENSEQKGIGTSKEPMTSDEDSNYYVLSLPLGGGRAAYVRVPNQISQREKERLLGMLDLMLEAQENQAKAQHDEFMPAAE